MITHRASESLCATQRRQWFESFDYTTSNGQARPIRKFRIGPSLSNRIESERLIRIRIESERLIRIRIESRSFAGPYLETTPCFKKVHPMTFRITV